MSWIANIGDMWLQTLAWAIGLTIAFGLLARLTPCNRGMYWWKDLRAAAADFTYWFFLPLLLRLGRTLMLWAGVRLLFGGHDPQPLPLAHWPLWLQMVAILLIQDVLFYVIHRFFHTRWAWKIHAVHHSPTTLDWTAAARFHPINNLLEFVFADVVVLLMGFSPQALLALAPFNLIYSAMTHANLNWTFGPLRYVFASPVFHRWHHTTQEEGLDKNFASTFPFLDLMFGSFYMPPGKLPEIFGNGEKYYPEGFWGQFIHPFLKSSERQVTNGERRGSFFRVACIALVLAMTGAMAYSVVHKHNISKRDQHVNRGRYHYDRHEFDRAILEFNEAIHLDPVCAIAFANRASAYFSQGEVQRAIDDCTRAVEINPRLSLAYANRAGAFLVCGDNERAIADSTRALELEANMALAYANRGGAHLNLGQFAEAIADCTRALQLDPHSATAFANRGAAHFNKGDIDDAIADCSRALECDAALPLAYLNRAAAYLHKGDNDNVIRDCNEALRLDPNSARGYALRGSAYFNKGDDSHAIADDDAALRLAPKFAAVYANRGTAHLRQGTVKQALDDFNEAIEQDPSLAAAYAYRGAIYLARGDSPRVIADCSRAIELDPHLALAYWNRGIAYVLSGDPQRAAADRKKALQLDPSLKQP